MLRVWAFAFRASIQLEFRAMAQVVGKSTKLSIRERSDTRYALGTLHYVVVSMFFSIIPGITPYYPNITQLLPLIVPSAPAALSMSDGICGLGLH